MNFEQKGREDGERSGFNDGLDAKPIRPSPELAPSLASIVYLHAYTAAYEIAYVKGCEARESIMAWRSNTDAIRQLDDQDRSRDDV